MATALEHTGVAGGRQAAVRVTVQPALADRSLGVMNFLNEVVSRYPEAISFAPGRPREELFDVEQTLAGIGRWVGERAAATGREPREIYGGLGQYGATNGIVREAIAEHLAVDEGIVVPPRAVMVTCGCQEAMLVVLAGLFAPGDVLLSSDPAYIGITGLARVLGVPVVPVATGADGLEPGAVAAAAATVRRSGRRPRALYDVPDFNNPLGTSLPLAARHELLAVARGEGLLVLEDSPYRMFAYDGPPLPTLKQLDGASGVVIYLGSFSKTLFPGLRLGYLVADQPVDAAADGACLAEALSAVKSLTTVNTPPALQVAAAAALAEHDGSLRPRVAAMLPRYRAARDRMLAALERHFGPSGLGLSPGVVRWNRPAGGFFLRLELPFVCDEECTAAAAEAGVIVCPMEFFSLAPGRERQVRLSFSYVGEAEIDLGVERLAGFVARRVAG